MSRVGSPGFEDWCGGSRQVMHLRCHGAPRAPARNLAGTAIADPRGVIKFASFDWRGAVISRLASCHAPACHERRPGVIIVFIGIAIPIGVIIGVAIIPSVIWVTPEIPIPAKTIAQS